MFKVIRRVNPTETIKNYDGIVNVILRLRVLDRKELAASGVIDAQ